MQGVPSAIPREAWFKSSYSGAGTTECVEAAHADECTGVRDSKCPHGVILAFSQAAWSSFIGGIRGGGLG
ncbi:DUF397 domain-containing protein [Streptomyces morookaense]|uniref:DUF397 domain-containing protein n=1 Tax=Streptomyces morookaense TaxID=1970 RepID=A0A7Y7BA94_STRMO|nr:DUF397 domain-containing protein [Streptomyces morookaense]NVK81446.1 DUF397 domain-containing protein [Streptomyces morookaense]